MNIWLMNHYATSMFFDRAGRHYWFAKELKKRGHRVTVFCANTFLTQSGEVDTHGRKWCVDKVDDIPFVFVKTPQWKGNGFDRIKNMVKFYLNLIPSAKGYADETEKPDVIIASSVHPLTMVAGIRIAKRLGIPCICEIRDLWPEAIFAFGKAKEDSIIGKILTSGEHWIYRHADALIFTKEGDTDYLIEKRWTTEQGGDIDLSKCHYINNGIDLPAYVSQITTDVLNDDDLEDGFNVIYTGTIRPVNNVGGLLDCAKILAEDPNYQDVKILVYGDGQEVPKLVKRIQDEHIHNVIMKGYVIHKYIPFILSRSAINVLNYSQSEYNWTRGNSSNKLFEYMASGKPIISTVKMGYSIINRYKCGIELNECTPECLALAIKELHDLPREELESYGANAMRGAEEFDFTKLTDKLITTIESVQNG